MGCLLMQQKPPPSDKQKPTKTLSCICRAFTAILPFLFGMQEVKLIKNSAFCVLSYGGGKCDYKVWTGGED